MMKTHFCNRCQKKFTTPHGTQQHIDDVHGGEGKVLKVKRQKKKEREPSFADRAVAAELAIAMGDYTDDTWLLP